MTAGVSGAAFLHGFSPAILPAWSNGDNTPLSSHSLCILMRFLAERRYATSCSSPLPQGRELVYLRVQVVVPNKPHSPLLSSFPPRSWRNVYSGKRGRKVRLEWREGQKQPLTWWGRCHNLSRWLSHRHTHYNHCHVYQCVTEKNFLHFSFAYMQMYTTFRLV